MQEVKDHLQYRMVERMMRDAKITQIGEAPARSSA
jgi:hypothetical protein